MYISYSNDLLIVTINHHTSFSSLPCHQKNHKHKNGRTKQKVTVDFFSVPHLKNLKLRLQVKKVFVGELPESLLCLKFQT